MALFVGMMMPTPTAAYLLEECIDGYIMTGDTQQPIEDLEIECYNFDLDESIWAITDENGYYFFDLTDFSDWNIGDTVKLIPGLLNAYFVCNPKFELDAAATSDQHYQFDLSGTPIPHLEGQVYENIDIGGAYMWDHQEDFSHVSWNAISDPYQLGINVDHVTIAGTPCISDYGVYDLPLDGYLDVTYHFIYSWRWHRQDENPDSSWTEVTDITATYTVSPANQNDPYNFNPVNFKNTWTATELLQPNEQLDIRFMMKCSTPDNTFEYWQKPIIYEHLDFNLVG